MRKSAVLIFPLFLAIFAACAASSRADTFFQVAGTMTSTGNNVCGGPCSETIAYSFEIETSTLLNQQQAAILSSSFTGSGSLGDLSGRLSFVNDGIGNVQGYIPMLDSENDEIDINLFFSADGSQMNDPYGIWWRCGGSCFADFISPAGQAENPSGVVINGPFNGAYPWVMTQTVTKLPEAPTSFLLLTGAAFLALFWRKIKSSVNPCKTNV